MDPTTLQPGEIVDVNIRGLRIESVDEVGVAQCSLIAHSWHPTINLRANGVNVERVTPADGEPQPGELWADQADNLYVTQLGPSGGSAQLVNVDVPSSVGPWEFVHRSVDGPIYRVAARPLIGGQS